MSLKIKLNATASPPTPPNETNVKLGNNVIVSTELSGTFTETEIANYVNTNNIEVKIVEIHVFTHAESNAWAVIKKGAGVYDAVDNPLLDTDVLILNKDGLKNVPVTQAEYDAIPTKDANTLYFIPLEP